MRLLIVLLVTTLVLAVRGGAPSPASAGRRSLEKKRERALLVRSSDTVVMSAASAKSKEAPITINNLHALLVRNGGVFCILGGALAHLIFGTLYCWSNLGTYAPPSLRFFDGLQHSGQPDSMLAFPLTLVAQCFAMPVGTIVVGKIGPQRTMLLGTLFVAAGVYLSSFAKTLGTFLFLYSIVFGTGVGLGYTAPMIAGWKYLPQSKGLVSGGILTGFGAGGFIFNLVGTALANPKGLNPVNGVFPQEVYDNFPKMLRTLATIYACTAVVASLLITDPAPSSSSTSSSVSPSQKEKDQQPEVPGVTVQDALKTSQFWLIWLMILTSASAGLNVASTYKAFANISPALAGDSFQSLVGGFGALANGFGRIFWGTLSDKIGFKSSFALLALLQALVHAYYPFTAHSKAAFTIFTCLSYFLLAGNFALMPPSIQKLFGQKNGALIYGLVYSAFGTASIGGLYMSKELIKTLGFDRVFRVFSLFSIVAALLTSQLQPLKSFPGSNI